jgi:NADH:ubiquinone reductase (H+-translocating)
MVIRRRLQGDMDIPHFHYRHAGSLATIGKRLAVVDFGRVKLRGALAWWIWGFAHIYFLIGLRNRLNVILNWLWIHLRDQRSGRLITQGRRDTGDVRPSPPTRAARGTGEDAH